jgi:putative membrane protein
LQSRGKQLDFRRKASTSKRRGRTIARLRDRSMFHKHNVPMLSLVALLMFSSAAARAQNTTSPSARDKKFMKLALEDGNAEVSMGHLAVQKGSSEDVKQFGQKMVDDHTHLGDQIRDTAEKEHLRAPDRADPKDREVEGKLKKLSGSSFDKAYIAAAVKDERRDLDEFSQEATHGNDTAIKEVASRGALLIGGRLQLAEQIARSHSVKIGH